MGSAFHRPAASWLTSPSTGSGAERIGLGEAVLCAGKTAAQIGETIALARARRAALLLTRLTPELLAELAPAELAAIDYDPRSRTAILGTAPAPAGAPPVAVVTAGTSDLPVAREAIRTLAFYGVGAREIADVGAAGLWRILRTRRSSGAIRW